MSGEAPSRHGWRPALDGAAALAQALEAAFDYRGDVTLALADGSEVVGYLYNRDAAAAAPFVQVFERAGGTRTIPYAAIQALAFTGRDMAAGQSYEAWRRRRDEGRGASSPDA
ncbi:MAG TPA: hypothetical protein VLI67_12010 [Vicinamibacteria bacterium]|nr:hypothetical protein [Vicinamibacteria bacterium]